MFPHRLTEEQLRGNCMKRLGLVLVLCGAAGLTAVPGAAYAFDIQGESASLSDDAAQLQDLKKSFAMPEFEGSSLAMPYIGHGDSGNVSDYGNSIPIPGPGIDTPAPAWSYFGR